MLNRRVSPAEKAPSLRVVSGARAAGVPCLECDGTGYVYEYLYTSAEEGPQYQQVPCPGWMSWPCVWTRQAEIEAEACRV